MKIEFSIIIADATSVAFIQIKIFDSLRNLRVEDSQFFPKYRFEEAKLLLVFLTPPVPRRAKDLHLEGPSTHENVFFYNNYNKKMIFSQYLFGKSVKVVHAEEPRLSTLFIPTPPTVVGFP